MSSAVLAVLATAACGGDPEPSNVARGETAQAIENGVEVTNDTIGIAWFGASSENGKLKGGKCSAVVLSDYWVLTAAHCNADGYLRSVQVGLREGARVIPVTRGFRHPNFSDAALLRLSLPASSGSAVYRNELYRGATSALLNKTLTCFGWAGNGAGNVNFGVLRSGQFRMNETSPQTFTAPQGATDALTHPGDSGGPCFVQEGGRRMVAGVLSTRNHWASAEAFRDWADRVMSGDVTTTEVVVSEHSGWTGRTSVLGPGTFPTPAAFFQADEAVTSLRVGSGVTAHLFDGQNFTTLLGSAGRGLDVVNLADRGMNDRTSSIAVAPHSTTECPAPRADEVTVYSDAGFVGNCDLLRPESIDDVSRLNASNAISSIRVGSNVRVRLYDALGFSGASLDVVSDIDNLTSSGFNDRVRSLRINGRGCVPPDQNQIVLWDHGQYLGECVTVNSGTRLAFSILPNPNLGISSVQVGTSARAALFDNADFSGRQLHLRSDHPFLAALDMNDVTSSVVAGHQNSCPPPGPREVVVWEDGGQSGRCTRLGIGSYGRAVNTLFDLGPAETSSMAIGSEVIVEGNDRDHFTGQRVWFTPAAANLPQFLRGPKPQDTWNDELRSLAVRLWVAPIPMPLPHVAGATLAPGEGVMAGQSVWSNDRRFRLTMQMDGNLVLYKKTDPNNLASEAPIWHSNTFNGPSMMAVMQADGNLVLYDFAGNARWASGTSGQPGSTARVQDDGNFVVYAANGAAIWASGTCCQ